MINCPLCNAVFEVFGGDGELNGRPVDTRNDVTTLWGHLIVNHKRTAVEAGDILLDPNRNGFGISVIVSSVQRP